jgi:hypothetical protein
MTQRITLIILRITIPTLVAELKVSIVRLALGKLSSESDELFLLFGVYSPYFIGLFYMRPSFLQKGCFDP